jgi:sulfopyruvate decarboxylase TPP-binding subunit
MAEATTSSLRAQGVVNQLRQAGITHVVWLPDTESKFMYDAIQAEPGVTLVPVCREGEAMPIALGLHIGGKNPVVLIQNTGFFESGDAIRGICIDLNLPVVIMIGYRGYEGAGVSMKDSAGAFLEPMLKTWGIPYHLVEDDSHAHFISQACREAQERRGPVAVLIGREYEG